MKKKKRGNERRKVEYRRSDMHRFLFTDLVISNKDTSIKDRSLQKIKKSKETGTTIRTFTMFIIHYVRIFYRFWFITTLLVSRSSFDSTLKKRECVYVRVLKIHKISEFTSFYLLTP